MKEFKNFYRFMTFKDNEVVWYKDSYERHCEKHYEIARLEGRNDIQDALISPDIISRADQKYNNGKIKAKIKIYRKIIGIVKTSRGKEKKYWEIILKTKLKRKKFKIVTAYITTALEYAIINDRIEKIEYKK
ncbi:MAG: hypothetical protein WD471_00885 [Candidatus Paceibacterota bacterium]